SAGRAAMAADASTVATNPAGMTLLDRTQLMITSGAMLPAINFDRGPKTDVRGGGGGGSNAGVFFPIGGVFYAQKLGDRLWLGAALYSNFGLASDYSLNWVGRYYMTSASLITGQVNPNIAYRVNDWLSVGAGFSFSVARFKTQAKINNILPRFGDGGLSLDSWDAAFGGKMGFPMRRNSRGRSGLTYNSRVDFNSGFHPFITTRGPGLSAALKKSGWLGAKVNLGQTEPMQFMASTLYQFTPEFALMGNLGWQNWAQFGQTTLGISAQTQRTLAVNLHYNNTLQIAFGGQYRL